MRKILTAAWVGVFFLTGSVCYGQVTPTLTSGTKAVLFTFDGLSFLRADNFDGGAGFKYFLSEENAIRVGLQMSKASSTEKANPVAPATGTDGKEEGTTFGISLALERHLRTARVSPYFGVGAGFSTTSTKAKNAVEGNPPGPQTTVKNLDGGHTISGTFFQGGSTVEVFGLGGFEFFLTEEVSFSAEYRLAFAKFSPKDEEITTGATTVTTQLGSSSLVDIASSGLFTLAIYF